MVRLVFRPYTRVRRTICTSVSLLASIRVSPDLTMRQYSSPPFGSQNLSSAPHLALTPNRYPLQTNGSRWRYACRVAPSRSLRTPTPRSVFQDGLLEPQGASARPQHRYLHESVAASDTNVNPRPGRPVAPAPPRSSMIEERGRTTNQSLSRSYQWSPNTFFQFHLDSYHTPSEVLFKFP